MQEAEREARLAAIGAAVLQRYRHPDDWGQQRAEYDNTVESWFLDVKELDYKHVGMRTAAVVASALRAWAISAGMPAGQLRVTEPHRGKSYRPRISVPHAVWTHQVLPKLKLVRG